MESSRGRAPLLRLLAIAVALASVRPALAEDWLPVTSQELAMTSEPKAPDAPAIYLYRQVDRDDNGGLQSEYVRIKILTDEGRSYGNVTLSFAREWESVSGIQARTIRPDGSIATFDGTVYEQPVYEARDVKVMAKRFTLPQVEKGCIIEYRFRRWRTFEIKAVMVAARDAGDLREFFRAIDSGERSAAVFKKATP